ncbi:MAG: pro-sigmaK processing inhibitor BofA [Clostridia bacterium]|nr:pro-sigmaK processing inhibitor BofA [Clostridia bacterium]
MDTNTMIIYIACICFLFLFGRIFILPFKSILKLVLNSCIGAIMIYIINLIGVLFQFHIGLNYITAIFTGILGVPGVILLVILKLVIGRIKEKMKFEK